MIGFRELPDHTVAQLAERLHIKRRTRDRILASVRFCFFPLRSFFSATLAKL